ncbi:MAG: DUF6754 domain-containing protein, partial [Myxococcota bacterium]
APPTDVRAERGEGGRVTVSWQRSADDGKGSGLVRDYQVLRASSPRGPFAPFAYARKDDAARVAIVDTSAASGRDHWYVVWALAGRESSTVTERGARPASSRIAGPAQRTGGESAPVAPPAKPTAASAQAPERDTGENVALAWNASPSRVIESLMTLRGVSASGPFAPFPGNAFGPDAKGGAVPVPDAQGTYFFAIFAVPESGDASAPAIVGPVAPRAAWFDDRRFALLALLALTGVALFVFVARARRHGEKMFIRRIPGIDALEEAIGRATEMGRPVLFVPGVEETLSTQTIASVLVLGHVAERVAKYGAELRVAVNFPMTLPLAQEAVKQGFLKAGRPDAYNPNHVQWISSEQFAFTAGTNGIILREKPATNIYLGRFYAESLVLAETGFVNRAIQIAGTAEIPQLPFFVAACDYTLIGEEVYAMSAYLSRQPALLGTLKGGDVVKLAALVVLLFGAGLGLGGWLPGFVDFFAPPG